MRIRFFAVSLCLCSCFLLSRCGLAQHMNAKDGPCQKTGSGAEETGCFDSAFKASDEALNRLYARVQSVVQGEDLAKLKTAERLWLQYRDANCDAEYGLYRGGSAAPMVKLACLEAVTRHRTEELNVMYGWRLEKWGK